MSTLIVISHPTRNENLLNEVEQQLAPHAQVEKQPPLSYDLEEVKLVVDVVAGSTTVLANAVAILTFLLMLKDRYKQNNQLSGIRIGKPAEQSVPLENADDGLLRQLLGIEENKKT